MNHPKPEEWACFAYGDCGREDRVRMEAHAEVCPDCRRELEAVRSVQLCLDSYAVSGRQDRTVSRVRYRWLLAAAASVAFATGALFTQLVGRGSSSEKVLAARLRPVILQEVKSILAGQKLVQPLPAAGFSTALEASGQSGGQRADDEPWRSTFADFLALYRGDRAQDRAILTEALQALDQQRRADYIRLRNDLETLALTASDQLSQTRSELSHLAVLTTSDDRPNRGSRISTSPNPR